MKFAYKLTFHVEHSYSKDDIITKVKADKLVVVESLEFWIKEQVLELTANGHYQLVEE